MSIPGVDAVVALSIVAAIGDITRFRSPDKLACYFGLNPRVRQSGGHPASHGRIRAAKKRANPAEQDQFVIDAKKIEAAFRISLASRNSAFSFFSRLISASSSLLGPDR